MQAHKADGHPGIVPKLSVVMFLQFFMWGAWYLSVSVFMNANGMEKGALYAYTAAPLAAILTPILMGLIVDRFFNTEKVLATLFIVGGILMLLLPGVAAQQSDVVFGMPKHVAFNVLIFLHTLCYMPTLGLTASLAFAHLPDGSIQFPKVRVWGTIGWIVAGVGLATLIKDGNTKPIQFIMSGIAGILLGIFCLTFPATPAPKKGQPIDTNSLLFMDAWRQMRNPSFLVFILSSFLVCIPLAAYYSSAGPLLVSTGIKGQTAWQNIGTFFEAFMMLAMPFMLRRLGVKKMIAVGILAWVVRYLLFAWGAPMVDYASPMMSIGFWLIVLGVALHGVCYDFFFVTGQIYVDNATPADVRGQCQGMNIFFTQGLGQFLGAIVVAMWADRVFGPAGAVGSIARQAEETLPNWPKFWLPLAAFAAIVMVAFWLFFKDEGKIGAIDEDTIAGPPMETPIEHA